MHINKRIDKPSLLYSILGKTTMFFFKYIYFKKIVIKGKENIPYGKPMIFAPNHQNALIDALMVIFAPFRQIIFLARADIFKTKIAQRFFSKLKLMPIFRLRDGTDQLKNNDLVFEKSVQSLKSRMPICLFPETTHTNKRTLLPVKKGVPRIGFQAEEAYKWELDLHIVPVGIYYKSYFKFRTVAQINYGKPIRIADYKNVYKENNAKGLNALRDTIGERLHELAIDIRNKKYYDSYEIYRLFYAERAIRKLNFGKINQENKFKADKYIISKVEEFEKKNKDEANQLHEDALKIHKTANSIHVHPRMFLKDKISWSGLVAQFLFLLIFSPFFICGLLLNLIPYFIWRYFINMIDDDMFYASITFMFGVFILPVIYLVQFAVGAAFFQNFGHAFLFLVSMPVFGLFAHWYVRVWRNLSQKFRLQSLMSEENGVIQEMLDTRKKIIRKLDEIV